MTKSFNKWRAKTLTDSENPRIQEPITELYGLKDALEVTDLTEAERRSAWRYLVYRFPSHTTSTGEEDDTLRLLLKARLARSEREKLV